MQHLFLDWKIKGAVRERLNSAKRSYSAKLPPLLQPLSKTKTCQKTCRDCKLTTKLKVHLTVIYSAVVFNHNHCICDQDTYTRLLQVDCTCDNCTPKLITSLYSCCECKPTPLPRFHPRHKQISLFWPETGQREAHLDLMLLLMSVLWPLFGPGQSDVTFLEE